MKESSDEVATAIAWLDALGAGRLDELGTLTTPEATWWGPTDRAVVPVGQHVADITARIGTALKDGLRFDVSSTIAQNDRVVVQAEALGTRADDRPYTNVYLTVFRFEGPLIAEIREWNDNLLERRALSTP